jgi:hypothetical protein
VVLVERDNDEGVLAVDTRVSQEWEQPVLEEGRGEINRGVMRIVHLGLG